MAENNHVITVVLVALICRLTTFTNVGAQTASSCKADSITIKDAVTGSVQCQDCLKCPAGKGLSVKCGDFIDSQTPLMCEACVLGETYSSAYETGACKDCKNCGPYRETIKACTLTSKAVCGKCKVGAYEEPMLSMCKPCSPCCNDGKDIVISQCQVPGAPANKQCSFARSGKCNKVVTTASVSTVTPNVETNYSTVQSTTSSAVTHPVVNSVRSEPIATLPYDASPSRTKVIVGSVLGGVCVVFVLPLVFLIRYGLVKRRKTPKRVNDLALAETVVGERPEQVQGNDDQANAGKRNETADQPTPAADIPAETTVPVQESGHKSQDKAGIQETKLPGSHGDTDFKLSSTVLDRPEPTSELHSHTKEPERNTTVHVTVDVTSSVKPVSV